MVEQDTDWEEYATKLAHVARDLLHQESFQDTLDRIAAHAVGLVEGCDAAGILTVQGGRVRTLAATDDLVRESDAAQGELGEGPCFDALRERERVYRVDEMARTERFPRFAPRAHALGVGCMMGFLLYTEEDNLGALNLYSYRSHAFSGASEHAGWVLASHAAVAMASARTHSQLRHALETRHEIGEAMGILMGRHQLTEEQAFQVLRKASQDHNIKLREVAARVTRTGDTAAEPAP
ncbi:GAF and ANTAR domain-containing protein [Streptomyces sp. NPDC059740]|uniref:GAF and ANTAR domain-containing protein n=1 Tax=Streptomyces sp. NPDC059740 TaxID=3346926 RepID=UPI003657CF03